MLASSKGTYTTSRSVTPKAPALAGWFFATKGFPCISVGKEPAYNAGDPGLIPGSGRFPGKGNDNPLQYSCLENPMDRGA